MHLKNSRILFSILMLLLCVVILFEIHMYINTVYTQPIYNPSFPVHTYNSNEKPGLTLKETSTPKDTIIFVGDVMLARNVETLLKKYGPSYAFSELPKVPTDSYVVGNFEGTVPLVHTQTPNSGFSFSIDAPLLEGLVTYGFTHMSLANNHSYDFGQSAFDNTYLVLAKNNIEGFGDQRNQASSTIRVLTVGTTSVALVGIFAVDVPPTQAEISKLLERATEISDVQIAFVHFGTEYKKMHSAYQEKLAHSLIDTGADAVLGHHPHVVQDIELYKNKPIFYSLGNFIFDQYFSTDVQEGLMLGFSLTDQTLKFELHPVTSIGSRTSPRLMSQYEKDAFLKQLTKDSDAELGQMIADGLLSISR